MRDERGSFRSDGEGVCEEVRRGKRTAACSPQRGGSARRQLHSGVDPMEMLCRAASEATHMPHLCVRASTLMPHLCVRASLAAPRRRGRRLSHMLTAQPKAASTSLGNAASVRGLVVERHGCKAGSIARRECARMLAVSSVLAVSAVEPDRAAAACPIFGIFNSKFGRNLDQTSWWWWWWCRSFSFLRPRLLMLKCIRKYNLFL